MTKRFEPSNQPAAEMASFGAIAGIGFGFSDVHRFGVTTFVCAGKTKS